MSLVLVISRYNEDLNWVNNIKYPYIIYNKGENNINLPYISTPNEGREGETYLRYIIDNYDNLPNYVGFCQGNPNGHSINYTELVNNTSLSDKVEWFSDWVVTETLEGHPHAAGYGMVDMLNLLKIPVDVPYFIFPSGAQYIVPKNFIVNKSKEWWDICYKEYNKNKLSPWIFERIWPLIFKYEKI